jgi:hypothetical protein
MKIKKSELENIIKEEIRRVLVEFDLGAELSSIGSDQERVDRKRSHRRTRDELLQLSIALEYINTLHKAVREKKSRLFVRDTPHGPSTVHYMSIQKLISVLRTVAKQIKDAGDHDVANHPQRPPPAPLQREASEGPHSLEEDYQPELADENQEMKKLIDTINNLGTEYKEVGYGGVAKAEREVDNLILGKLDLDFGEIVGDHRDYIFDTAHSLEGDPLLPKKLQDYLHDLRTAGPMSGGVFRPMKTKQSQRDDGKRRARI